MFQKISSNYTKLTARNGNIFNFQKSDILYFLNDVKNQKKIHSQKECCVVLGYYNMKDVLKLESVLKGIKIINKNINSCMCTGVNVSTT